LIQKPGCNRNPADTEARLLPKPGCYRSWTRRRPDEPEGAAQLAIGSRTKTGICRSVFV
jgi:hypothetical protein